MKLERKWRIMFSILPGTLLSGFRLASVPAAMYQLSKSLRLSGLQVGLILGSTSISGAIFGIPTGMIADKIGLKRTFLTGVSLMAIGTLFTAFSLGFYSLFFFTLLSSFGLTLYVPSLIQLLSRFFEKNDRGLGIGLLGSTVRISAASTFMIAPLVLLGTDSWRWLFMILGSISCMIALFLYHRLSLFDIEEEPSSDSSSLVTTFKNILNEKIIILTAICRIFLGGSSQSFAGFLPFLLQLTGTSLGSSSFVLALFWISQGAGTILVPKLSDIIKKRVILVTILGLIASSSLILLAFTWGNIILSIVLSVILGFIFAGITEILFLIPISDPVIAKKYSGGATGFLMTFGALGALSSNLFLGYLLDYSASVIWTSLAFIASLQLLLAFFSVFMRRSVS